MENSIQLDTPAMRQYRSIKDRYGDYILLFRMGDFYEMFYDDAKTASRVLGLTLTSRSKGPSAVPLAGIPYHALDSYLARLVKAGYRIAICEQTKDPRQAKGLVEREVVRLVTPGTLTDEHLLDHREGNYLAGIFSANPPGADNHTDGSAGLAWVELSSGAFWAMNTPPEHLIDELVRIGPAEVLIAQDGPLDKKDFKAELVQSVGCSTTLRPTWAFDARSAVQTLNEHFGTTTLAGFGFEDWCPAVSSAGAIIDYLRETQRTHLGHIRGLKSFDRSDHMSIDGNTLRSLEVHRTLRTNQRAGSLLECIDRTCTGMGARLMERWLTSGYSSIVARQDAVEEFSQDRRRFQEVRKILAEMSQIDRISANIAMARVRPRELIALSSTLTALPALAGLIEQCQSDILCQCRPDLLGLDEPARLIASAICPDCPNSLRDGGVIAEGFDEELDRLRRIGTDGRHWLGDYQARQIELTGITTLKVGYNKVFGYYIEVTNPHLSKVPPDYARKQTLKNAERFITDDLKRYEAEVLTASERAKALEEHLYNDLLSRLGQFVPALQKAAEAIATIDVLAGLAELACQRGYIRPTITQDTVLRISAGRHPVLAEQLKDQFVPNDVFMDAAGERLLIVTGPNMAGKSTYIRQVALLVLLAQMGSFIPAESATIGLVDRIFTRVGAADELSRGLSTFMLEMVETANILNNATSRSLVILDEVGRGTSTCDGVALAWAISEHLAIRLRCRTLFATHYHELTELADMIDGIANLNVAVREWADQVVFLHKIIPGGTDRSYGVHVARLAGVPGEVIERARTLLPQLQAHLARGLDLPELARRASSQLALFADPSARLLNELKNINPDNLTPMEALELLRKWKADI